MNVDAKNNCSILTKTLKKTFKEAKKKGTYSVKELFFLNVIFKTLSFACKIGMTTEQQRKLTILYYKILNSSEKFCVSEFESNYYKSESISNSVFIQSNNNNAPTVEDFSIRDEI